MNANVSAPLLLLHRRMSPLVWQAFIWDLDMSDKIIAMNDDRCSGVFFHNDRDGEPCVYEVWED
jgi:hypothetical protein